jgi:CubicO group peptidase (beta-lactamase class C family)
MRSFRRQAVYVCVWALLLGAGAAHAQDWAARHGLTAAQYQADFSNFSHKGYRLKCVSGYTIGGQVRYATLWEKTSGPAWTARHGLTAAQYQQAFSAYAKQGYRLTYINGYGVGHQAYYAAIWEKTSGPAWTARHGLTAAQYQQAFTAYAKQGYRLRQISGYNVGGTAYFAAIWDKSSGAWAARHGLTAAQYQQAFSTYTRQGYRLKVVSGYQEGGQDRYAALWEKSSGAYSSARHGIPGKFYQYVFDNYHYQGYHPVYLDAFTSGSSGKLNGIWENTRIKASDLQLISSKVAAYMSAQSIPGLSLAITRNGRLVYAAGFGMADQSAGEQVSPDHLFRIASVSKPFTSVSIMHLVEQNGLHLTDKVFGPGSLLGGKYATPANNPKLNQIVLKQLLEHVAGFTTANGDPMFEHTDYSTDQLINYALANKTVTRAPGSLYEYSNFGFCLLGRIIEQKTGQSYENYVRNNILKPMGITRMVIAANSTNQRKGDEVVYYPSNAYNLNVTRFDSHGGWLATPIDLMRFMVRVDGLPSKPDFLKPGTYTTMTTKAGIKDANGKDPNYAFGWVMGSGYQWHNGAMPGTLGLMARAPNGIGYAAVINTRPGGDQFAGKLKQTLDQIVAGVSAWPAYDLF